MGLKSLRNTVFWLTASNCPYWYTLPDSLPFRGAKLWPWACEQEKYPHFFHFCPKISWPIFFQLPESFHMWLILWSNVVKIIVNCSQNYGPIMVQNFHLCLNKKQLCNIFISTFFNNLCPMWLDCGPIWNVNIEPFF